MSKSKVPESLITMRHSVAHILAQAVLQMFPEAKLGMGPDIKHGFYYDFELPRTLIPEDLPLLEKKMKHIIKQNQKFEKYEEPVDESLEFLKKTNQTYKIELANDLKEKGEKVLSFYKNVNQKGEGTFVDMCAGPHVPSTSKIGVFKLTSIAGAYWKGSEENPMLQRIYGVCFETKEELDQHLTFLKEAKRRDHRKLGKDLDLFSFQEEGTGFPFWHPKGMIFMNELLSYWKEKHNEYLYEEIRTPLILNEKLWHQSGHWQNYKNNMYFTEIDEVPHAIKPMNCPGAILVYKNTVHSYKEFPLRWAELGLVHRHELSGVLHGLFRVRSFTQDDAHHFCTPDQIEAEYLTIIKLFDEIYSKFGFEYHIELSTRPKKSIGDDEMWEKAEALLHKIIKKSGKEFQVNEGDGAFYGPKLDFHLKDCLGRSWQCGTIQLDFSMPERFEMEYVNSKGETKRPVMIHRALLGSVERFAGILIEHFAGAFPTWLAPVQVHLIPVASPHQDYAQKIEKALKDHNIRVQLIPAEDSLGKRIRNAETSKIPYMLVLGDKELESNSVNVRKYGEKDQVSADLDTFIKNLITEISKRN